MDPFGDRLPTIETPRLRLRHVRASDAGALLTVFGDADALRHWGHGPLADLAAARAYVRQIEEGFTSGSLVQWAIADREMDQLIGTVTLTAWSREHRRAEIGFILGRTHWGQGLAGEAVRALLQFAFDAMDLHRVEADVHPENAASLRLLERLGFRREGLLRERWLAESQWGDSVLLGLLRREFAG